MSNLNTSWLINQLEKDIKAQLARIAELEEYVARLERVIDRSHIHLCANNKAVALNILRAYIKVEKEHGTNERTGLTVVPRSREPRPDYGPAARGKSSVAREVARQLDINFDDWLTDSQ